MAEPVKFKFQKAPSTDAGVLALFPQGPPPNPTSSKLKFTLFETEHAQAARQAQSSSSSSSKKRKHTGARRHRILQATCVGADSEDIIKYEAQNFGAGSSTSHSVCRYGIGVFNPKKKVVKVAPVDDLFVMQQVFDQQQVTSKHAVGPQELNYRTRNRMLVERFGSKKRKRQLKAREANEVNVAKQHAIKAAASSLEVKTATVAVADSSEQSLEELRSNTLPPFNATTTDVASIYKIEDMIPSFVWSSLDFKPMLKRVTKTSVLEKEADSLPAVVVEIIRQSQSKGITVRSKDVKKERKLLARLLLCLTYAIRFRELPKKNKAENIDRLECDDSTGDWLLSSFCQRTGSGLDLKYSTNLATDIKLVCHIAILALHSAKFQLNATVLTALAADLKLSLKKLMQFMREVGARSSGSGSKRSAKLVAPLVLPKIKRSGPPK